MTVSAAVPVAFEVLFLATAVVGGLAPAKLTHYRFKMVLRENVSLDSIFNLDSLVDLNAEAILTPAICIGLVWPLATYIFERRIDAGSDWSGLLIDAGLLLGLSVALRTAPSIKKVPPPAFRIAIAMRCVVFVVPAAVSCPRSFHAPRGRHRSPQWNKSGGNAYC